MIAMMGTVVSFLFASLVRIFSLVGGEREEEEPQLVSELLESLAVEDILDDEQVRVLWTRLCRRLRQSPEEAACYCHSVDPSPLLQCLTNTPTSIEIPLEVITSFLEAYQDAVFTSDAWGTTPLLVAARRASYDTTTSTSEEEEDTNISSTICLLLKTYPFAAQQPDKKGRLPLHYVRSHTETARAVLRAYPSAVAQKDSNGRLPLHYYCERTREEETQNDDSRIPQTQQLPLPNIKIAKLLLEAATVRSTTTSPVLHKDKKGIAPLDLFYRSVSHLLLQKDVSKQHQQAVEQLWDILTLLIRSATPSPTTPLVHALVSLHCPPAVLQEALRRFPHQATERDAQGCTPLLLAVRLLDDQPNANTQEVVAFLLQTHPRAARMTDPEGRLAIDVLSEKRHAYSPELFDLLVRAEPRAVGTRDLKNKQHPFLTAALAGNGSGVYHLLRAQPHVIRYFLNEC